MKKICLAVTFIFLSFFKFPAIFAQQFPVRDGRIVQISEDSSGSLLSVSDNSSIIVYDLSDYSQICELYDEKVSKMSFYEEGDSKYFAVMTKDGQYIVRKFYYSDGQWHCEDGEPYFYADCADKTGKKSLTAVSFSNNSDYVAAAFNDNTVQVHFRLRVTAGSISHSITTHKAPVFGLEFSRNGEYLATVSTDGTAYIWNSYTSSLITRITGVYARARVPVCFTEDSVYIVSLEGRNTFRISDFSGNTLYSILTGRPITAIKPLKDPDLIAVRNDKNEVMVYSISSRRPVSVTSVSSDSEFTSFEFSLRTDVMYAGFEDGKVTLLEPQPYMDDTSMLVTDSTMTGTGNVYANRFQSFSISAGANYLNKPYLISANLRGEYLYSDAIAPFFIGGGMFCSVGFPGKDFPASYKIGEQQINPPELLSAGAYVPVGYVFTPWDNDVYILTNFKAGMKIAALAMITSNGSVLDTPYYAFFMSIGAGMQIKGFVFDINCEYDTVGKVSPSIYAGCIFKWGAKK